MVVYNRVVPRGTRARQVNDRVQEWSGRRRRRESLASDVTNVMKLGVGRQYMDLDTWVDLEIYNNVWAH